jgi:hypothetical protein
MSHRSISAVKMVQRSRSDKVAPSKSATRPCRDGRESVGVVETHGMDNNYPMGNMAEMATPFLIFTVNLRQPKISLAAKFLPL